MTEPNFDFEIGSSVLVSAPASDADGRPYDCVLHGETNALVAVTYDRPADAFLETWRNRVGTVPDFVRLVEVGGMTRSTVDDSPSDRSVQSIAETVPRPNDLDGVRAAIESALGRADDRVTLVFDSLTAPLEHVTLRRMILFFHAVSNLLSDFGAVGYFYYDSRSDSSTVAPFRTLADETVELSDAAGVARSPPTAVRDGPSLDGVFDALRSRRRRDALRYLFDAEGAVGIDELAIAVARRAPDEDAMTHELRRRYHSTLYQLHLPKLDSVGFIDFDERNHCVSIRESARWAESFLALAEE